MTLIILICLWLKALTLWPIYTLSGSVLLYWLVSK